MSKITVRVEVTVDGGLAGNGRYPTALTWEHVSIGSENPCWYGDATQRAVEHTTRDAIESLQKHVDLGGLPLGD